MNNIEQRFWDYLKKESYLFQMLPEKDAMEAFRCMGVSLAKSIENDHMENNMEKTMALGISLLLSGGNRREVA